MLLRDLSSIALIILFTLVATPLSAQAIDNWTAEQTEARRQEIIRRYRSLLERRPEEGAVLDRLLEEVGSGRALSRLVQEYEQLAAEHPGRFAYPMILGHLYQRSGDRQRAIDSYRRASEIEPGNDLAWRSLASALQTEGLVEEACSAWEQALLLTRDDRTQVQILFALADIAFVRRDFEQASSHFERIVQIAPRDIYMREQLADALVEHGQFEEALRQVQAIVDLSGGNTRQRALHLGSMGDLLVELGRIDEGLARYREAQGYVRRGTWLWDDLETRIIEAYRVSGNLEELVLQYESQWRRPSSQQLRLLGELYQELGRIEQALDAYGSAVRASPRSVDARLDLIAILERYGHWEEVIEQIEQLIRISDEATHRFRLAEVLRQAGRQSEAAGVLRQMERSCRDRIPVLAQLADVYLRWGERGLARGIYERLVALEPDNPDFLIALGEFQFMEGERAEAVVTWQRILQTIPEGAQAQTLLAQVYAQHGLYEESLDTFSDALDRYPGDETVLQGYAEVLEEARRFTAAQEIWSELSRQSADSSVRAQARSRIIALYQRQGVLADRLPDYLAQFQADPPDRQAGYFLGESYTALGDLASAELIFLALLQSDDEDLEALLPLARMVEQEGRLADAIRVLQQVAELDLDRSSDHHYHIAELSLRLFQPEQAIYHASLAVAANPNNPRGHARLGQIYLRMERYDRAITAFQEAVRLDRRGSAYNLELAEVYQALGRQPEAEEACRQVVRYGRDHALVLSAGQLALQINQAMGSLEQLLAEWEPLATRPTAQAEIRELLIRLASRLVDPLARQAGGLDRDQADPALAELDRLAPTLTRCLLPLLTDPDRNLALAALTTLANLPLPQLASPISRLLTDPDPEIRRMAALALGRSGEQRTTEALLNAIRDDLAEVRALSAWALGLGGDSRATAALANLLATDPAVEVRAMAAIALGELREGVDPGRLAAAIGQAGPPLRRAIIWSMGAISDPMAAEILVAGLDDPDPAIRTTCAWSLGRLPVGEEVVTALVTTFWMDPDRSVRLMAARAIGELGRPQPAGRSQHDPRAVRYLVTGGPEDRIDALLDRLMEIEPAQPAGDILPLLTEHLETLETSILQLVDRSNPVVIGRILDDLGSRQDGLGLGLLTWDIERHLGRPQIEARLELLARRLGPTLVQLAGSPEPTVASRALRLLARLPDMASQGEALQRLVAALGDPDPRVRRQAALAFARVGGDSHTTLFADLLSDDDCLVRAAAAESLGQLAPPSERGPVETVLQTDDSILARAGAARGLARSGGAGTVDLLAAILAESGPVLRAQIAGALGLIEDPRSTQLLRSLLSDPSPVVRAVAEAAIAP
ncbi:MAG: HEAT repeat domain-containing protein [Bradymonadales bacterium]|nr:HEAT repeat domain-containing protein [Bradymonadales bacterium]